MLLLNYMESFYFRMQFKSETSTIRNYTYSTLLLAIMLGSISSATDAIASCNMELPVNELPNYNATDFQDLDAIVDTAQFINFGESSHGLTGMHLGATRMFRYLVE